MAFENTITKSLHGRELGLALLSTSKTGGSRGNRQFLVGPDVLRVDHSTDESTSENLLPFGVSVLTTAESSGVYTLDPPIPGVPKTIVFASTATSPIYVKTANDEPIASSQGSTNSVLASSQGAFPVVRLWPQSTGAWAVEGQLSSGYVRTANST